MTEAGGKFMFWGMGMMNKVSYWHYLHESTNNFQCLVTYFSNNSQFIFLCCHYNHQDSITNMMFLPGFPFLCLTASGYLFYKDSSS